MTRRPPACSLPLILVGIFGLMPIGARAQDPLPLDPLIPIPAGPVSLAPAPWQVVGAEQAQGPWEPVSNELALAPEYLPKPAVFTQADLTAVPRTRDIIENVGIFGIGGGVRFGAGDTTNGLVTGRVGYKLNGSTAISVRPSYIIYGTNNNNNNNNNNNDNSTVDGALRLPLTVDFNRRGFVSPYIGGGIATNTDNTGTTNGMLTGGLDLNIHENVTLGLNVNYIFQSDINDTDWEAMTLLYLKF
ncbi:outer membrane beta-barrel protein [Cyanobium sp. FGCU-52]|nr:outer membrane beta-barrel protein [Cyanobium sp. FGCU52]